MDETPGKEAEPCEFKRDTIPDSVGETIPFHLDGFWSGQAGNTAAPQLDRYIRAGDGAGTLLGLRVIAADPLCTIATSFGR